MVVTGAPARICAGAGTGLFDANRCRIATILTDGWKKGADLQKCAVLTIRSDLPLLTVPTILMVLTGKSTRLCSSGLLASLLLNGLTWRRKDPIQGKVGETNDQQDPQ
jgi:hypothetical protein